MNVTRGRLIILVFIDDVLANTHTLITDEDGRTCDQFSNIILTLVAKRTSQDIIAILLQASVPLVES